LLQVLPAEVTEDMIKTASRMATLEMKQMVSHHPEESLALGIGPFLKDLLSVVDRVKYAATHRGDHSPPKPEKLFLFSAHDTTVMPLQLLLGVLDDTWSPYSAALTFEILQDVQEPAQFYVRTLYNNSPLTVPACGSSLCQLQQFQALLQRHIPKDFESACVAKNKGKGGKESESNTALTGSSKK
jgi:hypothetical protein